MLRAYEGMEGRKTKNKEIKKKGKCYIKQNTRLQNILKNKIKFLYKPTCEVGSV
jgi:hypothetical protein